MFWATKGVIDLLEPVNLWIAFPSLWNVIFSLSSMRINLYRLQELIQNFLTLCVHVLLCMCKREKVILIPDVELWEINVQVSDLSQDDLSQEDCGQ